MLESKLETKCTELAYFYGWLSYKFTINKGLPDRIFLKNGKVFFVEFKKSTKNKLTASQFYHMDLLLDKGFDYYIITSISEFKNIFNVNK